MAVGGRSLGPDVLLLSKLMDISRLFISYKQLMAAKCFEKP